MFMTVSQITDLEQVLRKQTWQPTAQSRRIGYARVSTQDQNLAMQIADLRANGVEDVDLFYEQVSASSKKRPMLQAALNQCRKGDVFVTWKFDRVARSLEQLLRIVRELSERGVGFVSLSDHVDTTTPIGVLYMQMSGAFAQFELEVGKQRTRAGVKRAKERGVRFGRKLVIDKDYAEHLIRSGWTLPEVAKECKVSKQTVRNHFAQGWRETLVERGPLKAHIEKYGKR